ncbi:sensor histidine kinase [Dethiosulfovibrio salsuginis]|nr:histidine kinase dimerization/phosphoacceptor domain -containing protein [Dethiosulfovibrio salsuginis]
MSKKKKTILLVGGRAMAVEDERTILEAMGYDVITVENDHKALALMEAEIEIDLVLLAFDLGPDGNPFKLAERIRMERGIPVVFLAEPGSSLSEGYEHLIKGSDRTVFSSTIGKYLSDDRPGIVSSDKKGLFEALVEQIDDIVVVKDLDLRIVATNHSLVKAAGCTSVSDLLGKTDDQIFGISEDEEPVRSYMADERHAQTLPQGQYILKEEPIVYPDGRTRIFLTKKYPIYDPHGRIIGTGNISRDISDRKESDRRIQALLEEKELILRESHHRIKNNMNTVMSILSLHAWSLTDPVAVGALNDARNRLSAMALLYDRLYRSGSVESMSIKDYLPPLVEDIVDTFPQGSCISTQLEVEDVILPAGLLSSLGILINELVTNSMKYAFVSGEGSLKVSVRKGDQSLRVEVSDDGPGFPDNFCYDDLENSSGFGMRLISMLVRQLRGSVTMKNDSGAISILEIPFSFDGVQKN